MLENGLRGDIYQSYLLHLHSILGVEHKPQAVNTAPVIVGQNAGARLDFLCAQWGLTNEERYQMLSVAQAVFEGSGADVTSVVNNDRAVRIAKEPLNKSVEPVRI